MQAWWNIVTDPNFTHVYIYIYIYIYFTFEPLQNPLHVPAVNYIVGYSCCVVICFIPFIDAISVFFPLSNAGARRDKAKALN